MTRQPPLAFPRFYTILATTCALLGAAALAAPAQAAVIGFDNGYGPVAHGETYQESGFSLLFDANKPGADGTSAVGAVIDGSDPWVCEIACPVNNAGMYYGAFNDSVVWITSEGANPFRLLSLDASFIGHTTALGGYPAVSGLLSARGYFADGSYTEETLSLDGPSAAGFEFGSYGLGAFSQLEFVEIALYGYACDLSGQCNAFGTNRGQFAIDNLELVEAGDVGEVPEPATGLIFGLGLIGLAANARRRNRNAGV